MNKNLSITHLLLLLPLAASSYLLSMEPNDKKNQIEESVIVIQTPTIRGLGFGRYLKDRIWCEEDNTFATLSNKTFDLNNSSNHRKLDTAIEIYSSGRPNSQQLAQTIALCRQEPYKGYIQITARPFRLAHKFLVQENKNKQSILKNTIEKNDKNFVDEYNILLKNLQDIVAEKIKNMNVILNKHIQERQTLVKKEGDEIRILKEALVNLHHLNKEKNILITDEPREDTYCSDDETNPDNVKNSYNDERLLKKINVNYSMEQTKTNTEKVLKILTNINSDLVSINPVAYK